MVHIFDIFPGYLACYVNLFFLNPVIFLKSKDFDAFSSIPSLPVITKLLSKQIFMQ